MTNKHGGTLTPKLVVADAQRAIRFYVEVFGAREDERLGDGGQIVHSVLCIGDSTFGVIDARPESGNNSPSGPPPVILQLEVDDPDATASLAERHGAEILFGVADRPYGRRDCRIRDPFGHLWIVGRQIRA